MDGVFLLMKMDQYSKEYIMMEILVVLAMNYRLTEILLLETLKMVIKQEKGHFIGLTHLKSTRDSGKEDFLMD